MKAIDVLGLLLNKLKNLGHLKFKRVDVLPHPGEDNIIYLVPRDAGGYEYYIYISDNDEYEDLGNTNIDLTQYATSANLQSEISARTAGDMSLLTAINSESLRAQGVEEDLQGILNAQTLALEDVSSSLTELENEVGDLDVCIEEHLVSSGLGGYRKYNSGYMEQWGLTTLNAGLTTIDLYTPFKDDNYNVFTEIRDLGNFFHCAYAISNSQFNGRAATMQGAVASVQIAWRCYGRWK